MPGELDCDERKRAAGTTIGENSNRRKPVARTAARQLAYARALQNVLGFYPALYTCPEDCPNLLLIVKIAQPIDDRCFLGPIPGGPAGVQPGWTCRALCDWSIVIGCTEDAIADGTEDMVEQDLECFDEQATARGTVIGSATDPDQDVARHRVESDVLERATLKAAQAIDLVTCAEDCPDKKIRVTLSPPIGTNCPQQPNADGDFTCTSNARWRVAVTCY